jgi:acid phosphatase family membrane protein YuiD
LREAAVYPYYRRMSPISKSLLIAAGIQISCQLYKLIAYSLRDRRLRFEHLITAGGFPSSHSAFVTALATAVGFNSGPASDAFAIAFVFGAIVIYDAIRLRGAVEKHARLLNVLTKKYHPEEYQNLREMIGHKPSEVITGVLIGGGLSAIISMLWR